MSAIVTKDFTTARSHLIEMPIGQDITFDGVVVSHTGWSALYLTVAGRYVVVITNRKEREVTVSTCDNVGELLTEADRCPEVKRLLRYANLLPAPTKIL